MPLLWRVFLSNAAVLAVATLALAVSPLTVSFPIALAEIVVLGAGVAVMLAVDLVLLRRALAPLRRLARVMRGVDPLRPGERAPAADGDPDVAELTAAFNDMLERLEAERRASARRALAAQESERQRVARELHDEVGQVLTAAVLQLDHVCRAVSGAQRAEVDEAREAVRASLEGVRDVARRLRPEALDDLGLGSALAALTNDVERRTRVRVRRSLPVQMPQLPAEEELVVYRIVQEALTNAVRHGEARSASVTLTETGSGVEVTVVDDGRGFDVATARSGEGLRGMRERAVLVGATFDVSSDVDVGTTVRLALGPSRAGPGGTTVMER
jgi:two-component system, NarL family, sensor histidine kinase UhpB